MNALANPNALSDVFRNADPASVERELNTSADALDTLGKELDTAVEEYNDADEKWLELYDQVGETLREEYREAGRKSDPAEHVIVSATRTEHRAAYTRWKRSRRDLERIEKKMQALGKVLSARQTQANGLREEMRAGTYSR